MKINQLIPIKPHDTIGLVVMSGVVKDNQDYHSFIKLLNDHGYKVKVGKTLELKNGFLAGTDKDRSNELMEMFKDDEVKAILCYKGGYGAQRILPYLDYAEIRKHPKLLMGFSDVTILLNTLYQKANLPTVHGMMGVCLNKENNDEYTLNDFFKVLDDDLFGYRKIPTPFKTINPGKTTGILVGGNLSLIYALMGTEYEIDFRNKILFIEDLDEATYSIDRMLSSLILSKKLKNLKGIICGYFTNCEESSGVSVEEVLKNNLKDLQIPFIINYPSGHSKPFVNLPIGLKIELDTDKGVTVLESLYKTQNNKK